MAVKLSTSFPVGFFLKVPDNIRDQLTDNEIATAFPRTTIKHHDLGFYIYFEDCRDIPRFKTSIDNSCERYSLYTSLTVRNVFTTIDEKQLRWSLEQTYGKVLKITSGAVSKHIHVRNWEVILDVPEIPDSFPFIRNGYPNTMSLGVLDSLNGSSHHFNVTFHCRSCKKDGHIDKDCSNPNNTTSPSELTTSTKTSNYISPKKRKIATSKSTSTAATCSSTKASTDAAASNHKTNMFKASNSGPKAKLHLSTRSKAIDFGINEGGIHPDTVQHANVFNLRSNDHNQSESGFQTRSSLVPETKLLTFDEPVNSTIKTKQTEKARKRIKEKNEECSTSAKKYKSSCESNQSKKFPSEITLQYKNSEQDFNFAYSSTRPAPASSLFSPSRNQEAPRYSASSSTSISDIGESFSSNIITGNKVSTPGSPEQKFIKKEEEDQLSLIDKYVEEAGGVLTREEFTAFLVHSKKKSNLETLLHQYKIDAESLLKQVDNILDLYYKNPDQGTKTDKTYVKKLESLKRKLERSTDE